MGKTLQNIQALGHVAHVDDERSLGHGIIVMLNAPWCYHSDPGCGTQAFDTVAEAKAGTALRACYRSDQA